MTNTLGVDANLQPVVKLAAIPGYAYGLRYPSLVLSFRPVALKPLQLSNVRAAYRARCPNGLFPDYQDDLAADGRAMLQKLILAWQALQVGLGLPVFEAGRLLNYSSDRGQCVIPTLMSAQAAMSKVVSDTFACLALDTDASNAVHEIQRLHSSLQSLGRFAVQGSNVPSFVKAAYEMGLPFQELVGGVYQYGVGSRARWMESTFTDVTPNISAKLARSKVTSARLLRRAGLPVPVHHLVAHVDVAVSAAQKLGYPVVVKPADQDGGVGVAAGLLSEEEVRHAYSNARRYSKNILVEKHVEGRDYRLTVFDGKVIWAIERVPASVVGDGSHTVDELVQLVNADPRRGVGKHFPLKKLQLDDEAILLLGRQGLDTNAVPADGRRVRLRRAANVASGGMPVAVFDDVHPDNARLAVRAVATLRLDLAGVDLLIPDIAVSWRETGAAICEVNGQPNLGQTTATHLYAPILKHLLPKGGRVPTIVIFGAAQPVQWVQALENAFAKRGLRVGATVGGMVNVAGGTLSAGGVSPYRAGEMLVLDRAVDAMVVAVEDDSLLRTGLPFERCDAVILAGANLRSRQRQGAKISQAWLPEVLNILLPACDGVVFARSDSGLKIEDIIVGQNAGVIELLPGDLAEAAATACNWVCQGYCES